MKCPECSHNQLRGKNGMTCTKCGYEFQIDPKKHNTSVYKLTDGKFHGIIKRVSRDGTFRYTEDELYYVAALKTRERSLGCCLFMVVVAGAFAGFWAAGMFALEPFIVWFVSIAVILISLGVFIVLQDNSSVISRRKWNRVLASWQKRFGPLPGLISEPGLHQEPDLAAEPDIYHYGASQLIICQNDIQVDWLVTNNFHTANGAVIISESGYPDYIAKRVDTLINENPDLKISLIHDAGPVGEQMVTRVRSKWPFDPSKINDMGINDEMLDQFKVHKSIRKSFGANFPLHAMPFPMLSSLLSKGLVEETSFVASWEIIYDSGASLDGGAEGDGDGE